MSFKCGKLYFWLSLLQPVIDRYPISHLFLVFEIFQFDVSRYCPEMYLSSSEIERDVPLTESVQIFPCDFACEREERLGTL